MNFFKRMRKILNLFLILFPFVFFIGFRSSYYYIQTNQYLTYKMVRLIALTFQKSINYWTLLLIICCIILFLILCVLYLIGKFLPVKIIEIHFKYNKRALKIVAIGICCLFFFVRGGWAINHYWLPGRFHPISLIADFAILIFTIFLGRILIKIKWEKLLNTSRLKNLKKLPILLLILLLLLNVSIFVDSKINTLKHPNILFIIIDTLRADHLSCYGYTRNTSPNIDKLSLNSSHSETVKALIES